VFLQLDAVVNEVPEMPDDRQQTPSKLVALQSKFSDSDSEETREHRKTRMVRVLLMLLLSV